MIVFYSSETCSIEPSNLHTEISPGQKYSYCSETNVTTSSEPNDDVQGVEAVNDDDQSSEDDTTSTMVDWSVALKLSPEQDRAIGKAFACIRSNECGLNQSLSFIKETPLFLDIEVNKQQPSRDPELSLAIWVSGALKKQIHHG